jgi:putative transposase
MPRNARCVLPDTPYHVTQRGTDRQRTFFSATDHKTYLMLLKQNLDDAGVRVLAYCLMSNHVHFVAIPEREDSLAVFFRRVHGRYAQYLNARRHRTGHLWQNRFFSCPLSGTHLWVALRYVEQNPCRAGITSQPEHHRWSSAAAHLGLEPDRSGILDLDFFERSGGAETWREMHTAVVPPDATLNLRRCTYAGRPFGEPEFIESFEAKFQRRWRRPKPQQQNARTAAQALTHSQPPQIPNPLPLNHFHHLPPRHPIRAPSKLAA